MNDQPMCFWVYILLCENNSFYTGYTNNLKKRYQSHINGSGKCKYTKSFKPLGIAQSWKISGSKARAMQLECLIKKISRAQKEHLIAHPDLLNQFIESSKKSTTQLIDLIKQHQQHANDN